MRRSSSFKDILIDLIEEHQDEILALDPEYIEGGSYEADQKFEALHSGDISLAMAFTRNRRLKGVFQKIESKMDALSSRRSASEILRNLENRVAKIEKKAIFAKQIKKERPKSRDITPTHSDFDYYEIDFDHFLRKERLSKDEYVLTHMRIVASQTKTVPVTRYNPDGGETTVLMAFYVDQHAPEKNWDGTPNEYAGQYSHSTVMYFKYWDSLLAGGSLVNGELISTKDAEKYIREAR